MGLNSFQRNILKGLKPGEYIKISCLGGTYIRSGHVAYVTDTCVSIICDDDTNVQCVANFDDIDDIDDVEFYLTNKELSCDEDKEYNSKPPELDPMVTHPNHYQSPAGLEVWDVIEAFTSDLTGVEAFDTGNCIKYILRWHKKNGLQDLKKCKEYLEHLIKHVEEKEND